MATVDNKENVAPDSSSDPLQRKGSSPSPKKAARKGRSKSIGPGGLEEQESSKQEAKQDAKNRRKSTYVPTTKSIISTDIEKAERQAARRKTLANRRVSFAPEATLHTWDVVEFMRDPTTSTDSSDNTRRTSKGSPYKRAKDVDSDPPSTPNDDTEGSVGSKLSPAQRKQRRRSSTVPNLNAPDELDEESSSGASGSSDAEDSDADAPGSDDETGTAMSLDTAENDTVQSLAESDASSTGSSARLEAALRQASQTAGTRGIEYDEFGDDDADASMELAGDEVTNAFKPWVEQRSANQPLGSASLDQENVNPFSPAFKAQLKSGLVSRPTTVDEEDTGEMSMDMTRAIGGIVKQPQSALESPNSQLGDGTMDLTQAVGNIQQIVQAQSPRGGQKRRRSTADNGSPAVPEAQPKRRRSSAARSSMGEETMDLTMAIGGVQTTGSPAKPARRKGTPKRRSSGVTSEQDEATMELTQAIGSIKPTSLAENTASSLDSNEELTMELTTVLGGIKAAEKAASGDGPKTPQNQSPKKDAQNTTPKDQGRFKDAPDSGPKKLLTPIFQKQVMHSAEKRSSNKKRQSISPSAHERYAFALSDLGQDEPTVKRTPEASPVRAPVIPSLGDHKSPLKASPSVTITQKQGTPTMYGATQMQLDAQLQAFEPSPTAQKLQRSSPIKVPATPEKAADEPTQEGRKLAESIKMMSTPRKETLKSLTPKTHASKTQSSPQRAPSSKVKPTPIARTASLNASPNKQLSDDLDRIRSSDKPVEKIQLQKFLDLAGIRFMDLTTTKRRMTHATTPSKAKKAGELQSVPDEPEVNFETAIIAGGCTLPELSMYEHACHELKRYISDGKRVIKELESETAKETPPLLQAYMAAGPKRKSAIDAQMRDIKTQARYRSKEMWYAWRTQLLEDLMKALQSIGEGLIKDDETLHHAEEILDQVLPGLVKQHEGLLAEAERLEREAETNEGEKEELEGARERLQAVDSEMKEKQRILQELQLEMDQQQSKVNDLEENKEEFSAAIKEAERVKEACRGVSLKEITALQDSIYNLEQAYNWKITSASSSPPTVTMTYKSQLKLFFHPAAFNTGVASRANHPISLTYVGAPNQPGTTLRFFLQLLRASLQALTQSTTRVASLLSLVSNGWDTALTISESERRLNLHAPTSASILSDERMAISTNLLLPAVRTKVRTTFEIAAAVSEDGDEMELGVSVEPKVEVVYGEAYDEKKMTEFVGKEVGGGVEGWDGAVEVLRERLVSRGAKGVKK